MISNKIEDKFFEIERMDNFIFFKNHSKYKIIIRKIPVKPKRKYVDLLIIHPNSVKTLNYELDMKEISIRFES